MEFTLTAIDAPAQAIIRTVGEFGKNQFVNFSDASIQYKGKNNLVSYVDIESERMLREQLGRLLPGSGFIGEEEGADAQEVPYMWVIDPVDGTTNYTHGVPFWAISVALLHHGHPVMGFVYEVMHNEMFSAVAGHGARLNGNPIQVHKAGALDRALLATGFPYTDFSFLEEYMRMFGAFMQRCHGLRRFGSAALDLAYVAAGRFDGFFEIGLNPWDVAAGVLIVREAGGTCSTFSGDGSCIFAKQICAGEPVVHAAMLSTIQEFLGGKV